MVPVSQNYPFSQKNGLKLIMVLKWRSMCIYTENVRGVSLMACLKMEEFLNNVHVNHVNFINLNKFKYCHREELQLLTVAVRLG